MTTLDIRIEKFMPNRACMDGLFKEHWEESAKNKALMVLKPDWPKYQMLEDMGHLVSLFAYKDEEIVGYSLNILSKHIHYADLVCAHNDVIYIDPANRNSPVGLKIIKATEKECLKRGAKLMLWHAKEDTALSKILPRLGCKVQEIMFSKELKE